MNKKIINIILVVLCLIALCINFWMEKFSAVGGLCIFLMGILSIAKDKIHSDKE